MNLSNPVASSAAQRSLVRVDPSTFRLLIEPDDPSPVQRWNGVLADLIAANPIGPTRASRAFALLNSGFYDLWSAVDAVAAPVYGLSGQRLAIDQLEPALHQFAARLLQRWFPASINQLDQQLLAAHQPTLSHTHNDSLLSAVVLQQLEVMPALDPWGSSQPTPASTNPPDITAWKAEHIPIDNPNGPLQRYLTPAWGTLPAFSTTDIAQWRPPGPEPFLLVSAEIARLNLETASLELFQAWSSPGGVHQAAGVYDIRDPANKQWMIGTLINPAFIQQAQDIVDLQQALTDEQKLIAEFWENGAGTAFPPGQWMAITALMAEQHNLSLNEEIKLFFSVGQGVGDAGIAAWDAKGAFNSARPVRAIRDLASLNLLQGDDLQAWDTYQAPGTASSPPFPEYVSGHSTFSAAAAEVLSTYFGSDNLNLSLSFAAGSSRFEPGNTPDELTTLAWSTFSEAAASSGLSRLYGGIHFSDGNRDGQRLGRTVGDAVLARAASLAYADLSSVLEEPFLLRNHLELNAQQLVVLDGEPLAIQLESINLAAGDDLLSVANGATFNGVVLGGTGQDQISYRAYSTAVLIDLARGQASGLRELSGFEQAEGGQADDRLVGSAADNRLQGGGGNDWIDGGLGTDTAIYGGQRADFRFERNQVIDLRPFTEPGHEGTDVLRGIELISFADGTWPIADLFPPVEVNLSLKESVAPLLLREGQALEFELVRQGDLLNPIAIELNWDPQHEDRLTQADLLNGPSALRFTLPAGHTSYRLAIPTLDDEIDEGTEVGHLRLASAELVGAVDLPVVPLLTLDRSPMELVVLDNEPPPPPLAVQKIASSPLPLRAVPGKELVVPLCYSVSNQAKDLAGLSFQIQYPPSLKLLEFTPTQQAIQSASIWAAVDETASPNTSESSTLQSGAVRISFASTSAEWPGLLGAHLPLPIGTVRFAVDPGFSSTDALTGLNLSALDTASNYGFEAREPTLQLAKGWSLDADGDGVVRPLSDGLMIMRYLMGFQGSALTQKAMSPMGSRSTSASVAAWIERGRRENWLDFDGDGRTTALGDGLLMMRAMFGMQGDALLNKAIAPDSPLLEGYRFDQLSPDEKLWVGQRVIDQVKALQM